MDIPKGASERAISRLLAQQGVIESEYAFDALCRYRSRRTLQAGEYYFDHPQNAFAVFDTLLRPHLRNFRDRSRRLQHFSNRRSDGQQGIHHS